MPNIRIDSDLKKELKNIKENNDDIKTYSDSVKMLFDNYNDNSNVKENIKGVKEDNTVNETPESILSEVFKEESDLDTLFKDEDLEKKADLTNKQLQAISKAVTFANRYDNKVILDYVKNYLKFSISKQRKGRKEFVEGFKAKILQPMGLGGVGEVEEEEN